MPEVPVGILALQGGEDVKKSFLKAWLEGSLVKQILCGLILGIALAAVSPAAGRAVAILGNLFIGALKAVAPILVFFLVASSIANQPRSVKTGMGAIIFLYMLGTFLAALAAVAASFMFPNHITIAKAVQMPAPGGILEVLQNLLLNVVDNPIKAIANANYIGILSWGCALGFAMRQISTRESRTWLQDMADAITAVVRIVIRFAPVGIFGLVASTFAETGLAILVQYGQLLAVLVGVMALVAFVLNPAIVYCVTRRNPYPLVFECLRVSGVTAFFTRSSAANIPVNMSLCERLELDKGTYSVSIPLGATINMEGAAVTITVMTLAAAFTLGGHPDMTTAILLCVVSTLCACGTSGVAGGSILLIPLACGLFGISNDVAMQVVGAGFIIGVVQDSCETALNSSTDVLFTAAVCQARQKNP